MNKLPRMFCVTLHETPERTKAFSEAAFKCGLNVEIFYGITGRNIGLSPKFPNILEHPNGRIFLTDGALGCYLSHYTLWNFLQYLPEDEFLIFEDDAILNDNFLTKFQEYYMKLPLDWEWVYVGHLPYGNQEPVTEEKISVRNVAATHAYMVKKSLLPKLCKTLLPIQSPVDLAIISKMLPIIKYYVFDPPLVLQRSYSNTNDPEWNSLVYDWSNDPYGYKRKLMNNFSFGPGWYLIERSGAEIWKWSQTQFSINIPTSIDKLILTVSSVKPNKLTIQPMGLEFPIVYGNNTVIIPCKNVKCITGTVSDVFVPKYDVEGSNDVRQLGVCLKNVKAFLGPNELEIPIDRI